MEQILKRKDIILIPYPFTDQSGTKRRPALVISHDNFNKNSDDLVTCAITSNIDNDQRIVLIKEDDWKDGHYSESGVKFSNILTVGKKLVAKRIGRLSGEKFREVIEKIHTIIK